MASSIFIVGQRGDADLWLVDTGSGTATRIPQSEESAMGTEVVDRTLALRRSGFEVFRDVDVAVVASGGAELTSREFS